MNQAEIKLKDIDHDLKMFDENQELPAPEVEIEEIATKLEEAFNTKTYIQSAREYVYSEDVVIYFDPQGGPLPEPINTQTVFAAWIRISFLSNYAAIVWKKTENGQEWTIIFEPDLPVSLSAVNTKIHSLLSELNFKLIPYSILYQHLSTRMNQLDGSQATVYSALFSELD